MLPSFPKRLTSPHYMTPESYSRLSLPQNPMTLPRNALATSANPGRVPIYPEEKADPNETTRRTIPKEFHFSPALAYPYQAIFPETLPFPSYPDLAPFSITPAPLPYQRERFYSENNLYVWENSRRFSIQPPTLPLPETQKTVLPPLTRVPKRNNPLKSDRTDETPTPPLRTWSERPYPTIAETIR